MQNQQNLAAANNLLQQAQLDLTFVSLELIRHADTISTYLKQPQCADFRYPWKSSSAPSAPSQRRDGSLHERGQ